MTEELNISRRFTTSEFISPFDTVEWDTRDARITNHATGEVAFEQTDVEAPKEWSQNATNIVAQKYFRGNGSAKERSVRQMVERVVSRYREEAVKNKYLTVEEAEIFADELVYILLHQMASFNSPVWFNVGHKPQGEEQVSACFILDVEDHMLDILNWYTEEGIIFKNGSGAGINLSKLRSSKESLRHGGTASGPVSFMRGADASAGTIKSGGATRRAAKMVILNADHMDVREFIWCKALEEKKARVLKEAGFDVDVNGNDGHSLQYQNANNSVRASDEFMHAVEDESSFDLRPIADDTVKHEPVSAKKLLREIAQAAWECGDPGMQFDTTINDWHTCPASGRINASNPCSEYMHIDNSSCNLASINLLKFWDGENFDIDAFKHVVEIMFLAQEISISFSSFPTKKIGDNTRSHRQVGLGYANLGSLLMHAGYPYDSDAGRNLAANITSLMTGHVYATSAKIAQRVGPFAAYEQNRDGMVRVIEKHRAASETLVAEDHSRGSKLAWAAKESWDAALELGLANGYRNAQATVLAPTGTIGLQMDCDTTGIEPDLALKKMKKLVGGGTMQIINRGVPQALSSLGYSDDEILEITQYIDKKATVVGAPRLHEEHYAVFDTAMGARSIHWRGHVGMMAAVQPFISGAISKTVNLPEEATVEDIEEVFIEGWRSGLKAIAVYRDNCKSAQPLSAAKGSEGEEEVKRTPHPQRRKMPRVRRGPTVKLQVGQMEGYLTLNEFEDGTLGEIFLKIAKQGSTLEGILDAFAISISLGLQYGVPLKTYVKHYVGTKFDPAGITNDPDFRIASSVLDLVFRVIANMYLSESDRHALNIKTTDERTHEVNGSHEANGSETVPESPVEHVITFPLCDTCGTMTQPSGVCFICPSCGSSTGCS